MASSFSSELQSIDGGGETDSDIGGCFYAILSNDEPDPKEAEKDSWPQRSPVLAFQSGSLRRRL